MSNGNQTIEPDDSRVAALLTFLSYEARNLNLNRGDTGSALRDKILSNQIAADLFTQYQVDIQEFAENFRFLDANFDDNDSSGVDVLAFETRVQTQSAS